MSIRGFLLPRFIAVVRRLKRDEDSDIDADYRAFHCLHVMKCISAAATFCIVMISGTAFAKDFPSSVFRINQLDEAMAKAAEENKGLAFVKTEENSSCGLCEGATFEAFDNLKRHSVLVYLPYKEKDCYENLYPTVPGGFNAPGMGNTIPQVVITSPDMMTIWKTVDYPDLTNDRVYREVSKTIKALCAGETKIEPVKDPMLCWHLPKSSSRYVGAFQMIDQKGRIVLKMPKGGTQAFANGKLCAGAVAYARKLSGQSSGEAAPAESSAFKEEQWTSRDGKTIVATFVSLAGDQVTLRMNSGTESTFSTTRLSEESRRHAEELAAR